MLSVNNSYNQSEYFIPILRGLEKSSLENSLNKALKIGKIYLNKIEENYTFRFVISGKSDGKIAGSALNSAISDLIDNMLDNIVTSIARGITASLTSRTIETIGKG